MIANPLNRKKKVTGESESHLSQPHKLWQIIYIYTGIGFIHQMIHKPLDGEYTGRRPSNFVLWAIGVYVGLFSISFQRYENKVNRLTTRFGAYVERLEKGMPEATLYGFLDLQKSEVPLEADFWNPISVVQSFYIDKRYDEISRTVEDLAYPFIMDSEYPILTINEADLNRRYDFDDYRFNIDFRRRYFGSCTFNNVAIRSLDLPIVSFRNCHFDSLIVEKSTMWEVMDNGNFFVENLRLESSDWHSRFVTVNNAFSAKHSFSSLVAETKNFISDSSVYFSSILNAETFQSRGDSFYKSIINCIDCQIDSTSIFFKTYINGSLVSNSDSTAIFKKYEENAISVFNLVYEFKQGGELIDSLELIGLDSFLERMYELPPPPPPLIQMETVRLPPEEEIDDEIHIELDMYNDTISEEIVFEEVPEEEEVEEIVLDSIEQAKVDSILMILRSTKLDSLNE